MRVTQYIYRRDMTYDMRHISDRHDLRDSDSGIAGSTMEGNHQEIQQIRIQISSQFTLIIFHNTTCKGKIHSKT